MLKLDVNTKVPAKDGKPEMTFNGSKEFPETAQEAINLYGDTPVRDNAWANFKVRIQSNVRSWLKAGKSSEEIQTLVDGLVMGVSAPRAAGGVTTAKAKDRVLADWANMSDEDRKAFMAALKEAQKKAA